MSSTIKKSSHGCMAKGPQQGYPLMLLNVPSPISIFVQVWHILTWPRVSFLFSPHAVHVQLHSIQKSDAMVSLKDKSP